MSKLVVHHLDHSRSQRVLWLLEELGLEYEIRQYRRNPKTLLAPPELSRIHPLGKSPVVTDGEQVIAESGAIIEYLLARHGGGRFTPAPDSDQALENRYFMHYAEGSLMPLLVMTLVFSEVRAKTPLPVRPIASAIAGQVHKRFIGPGLAAHRSFLEDKLASRSWITGDEPMGADFQMSFPVMALRTRARGPQPHLDAYIARIEARPAWARAIEKGGPIGYD